MSDLITTENEDWALTNQASDTIAIGHSKRKKVNDTIINVRA